MRSLSSTFGLTIGNVIMAAEVTESGIRMPRVTFASGALAVYGD